MLDELEWPSLEARRDQSSLLLFHKIHSGAVSIEKDKYLTQSSRKRRIRRIFTPTFGFVRVLFLLGILIYAKFFSADASQTI